MKRVFDFVHCSGAFTPEVVVYLVHVGQSAREKRAAAYIAQLALNSSDYLWARHSVQMAAFFDRIEVSLFSGSRLAEICPHGLLRKKCIPVCSLARMLKTMPHALLNSSRIDTSCAYSLMLGTSKLNARSALIPSCLPKTL